MAAHRSGDRVIGGVAQPSGAEDRSGRGAALAGFYIKEPGYAGYVNDPGQPLINGTGHRECPEEVGQASR